MNEALQPLLDLLCAKFGWMPALVGWIGALRLAFRWFAGRLQERLTAFLAEAKDDPELLARVHAVLKSWPYQIITLAVEILLPIKFPTHAGLHAVAPDLPKP